MYSQSSPGRWCLALPALTILVIIFFASPCRAQNPVDPSNSYAEILCEFNLLTVASGTGDPLGDLGIIVHCYDELGDPVMGVPGSAFGIVNQTGTMVEFGTPDLATLATDDQGRIFLTEVLEASATLVHGTIAVVVSLGGEEVTIDNGGVGLSVEFRTPDLNHDGLLNLYDVYPFYLAYGCCDDTEACLQCDYNGDGCVTLADKVIFTNYYYGIWRRGVGAPSPAQKALQGTRFFTGCIQRDFDEDDDPATLLEEIFFSAGESFVLKLVAEDFVCLSGADFELAIPPNLVVNGPLTAIAPFENLQEHAAPAGSIRASLTAPYIISGPEFICEIPLLATANGGYYATDFVFTDAVFTDCQSPPGEVTACIGTPTPCDLSHLVQGEPHFVSCPGGDYSQADTITVFMRGEDGIPLPGLPAGGFRVSLHDARGSDRANTLSMIPLASETDVNGELDFLFEPRGICRWPDACLALQIEIKYEGCALEILKTVQTLNLARYDPADGSFDLIDDDDIAAWEAAPFTEDFCLDLTHAYRCPVVTQASIDMAAAHYLHGCDISPVPDSPGASTVTLHQNTPNPFNPITEIRLTLPAPAAHAVLTIYDLKGCVIHRLWQGPLPQGMNRFSWNGRDASNRSVGSGVYLVQVQALGERSSMRMLLLK